MEYYSAIKRNEIMPFAAMRMDLEMLKVVELLSWSGDVEQRTAEALVAQHHTWD